MKEKSEKGQDDAVESEGQVEMSDELMMALSEQRQLARRGIASDIFENFFSVMSVISSRSPGTPRILQNVHGEPVDVLEKLKDRSYRFIALDATPESKEVSEALTAMFREGVIVGKAINTLKPDTIKLGVEKRIKNADSHALRVFEICQNSADIVNAKSIRHVARILNEKDIPTARGGQWHIKTVTDLYKRWDKLGLQKDKLDQNSP